MNEQAFLRPISEDDCSRLFAWVNSPDSLAGKALTHTPITLANHNDWFAARLADPGTHMHIIEVAGTPVGQVRLQQDNSGAFGVDIYVMAEHRGQGVAQWAVNEAVKRLRAEDAESRVIALVRVGNVSSATLFSRADFVEVDRSDEFITFERKAQS